MKTLQQLLCFLLFLLFSSVAFSQGYSDGIDIDQYLNKEIPSVWAERFKEKETRTDFRSLRNFLRDRNDLLNELTQQQTIYPDLTDEIKRLNEYMKNLSEILTTNTGKNETFTVEIDQTMLTDYYYRYSGDSRFYGRYSGGSSAIVTLKQVKTMKDYFTKIEDDYAKQNIKHDYLIKNIKIVKNDIYTCNSQLDEILAPELEEQRFRVMISICFTALIGILLLIFFFILYKKSNGNLSRELLSSNGLQFITLFVLIIAIILFGILNILKGSELAAILSGISGYILGKGVGQMGDGNTSSAPPVTPAPVAPPEENSNEKNKS